jgi:hypothetical protein
MPGKVRLQVAELIVDGDRACANAYGRRVRRELAEG